MFCPYCGSHESCEHHLLSVGISNRSACGGELYELFNARLKKRLADTSADNEEFSESDLLDECIAEVEVLVASSGREIGGELASGIYEDFFCATSALVDRVVKEYAVRYNLVAKS